MTGARHEKQMGDLEEAVVALDQRVRETTERLERHGELVRGAYLLAMHMLDVGDVEGCKMMLATTLGKLDEPARAN